MKDSEEERNRLTLVALFLTLALWACFITAGILFLSSCTASPYWKDQPVPATPSPTPHSPAAAPVPINGWADYEVIGTVNIRTEPNTSSPSIGALYAGAIVRANCQRNDGFCEVIGGYVIEACLGIGEKKCQNK